MRTGLLTVLALTAPAAAQAETATEVAAAFGTRESVEQVSLSPDGSQIAFLAPSGGQGSTLFTVSTADGAQPRPALSVGGAPDRLSQCRWVSEKRLVCTLWGVVKVPDVTLPLGYSRLVGVDAGGGNQRMLSNRQTNARYTSAGGGEVIDWLPGQDGKILVTRYVQPTDTIGTNIGSRREGTAVVRLDTVTGAAQQVEAPRPYVAEYLTDGQGNVRVAGYWQRAGETFQLTGKIDYRVRLAADSSWSDLGTLDTVRDEGFNPYAVDADKKLIYGLRKREGRQALYAKALDGSGAETLIFSRPDVDVDGLVRIGRDRRVVGATYATEQRQGEYFDPAVRAMLASLHKALPATPQIEVVDASTDGSKLLVFASADTDPGRYYLFDKGVRRLRPLMLARPQLAGRPLASVKAITYPAADGSAIPGYLTLPPGRESAKGLPAIVLPHGGPSARDEWGFDWLGQFFAARGYAVLQPNYRGSAGYGDAFAMQNGFKSWRTAVGDVADAGRWLVKQGTADPAKLAIFGWSYGGYAALQSAVVAPGLFKAVVAVAPVTDLATLRQDAQGWANYSVTADFIGRIAPEASPAQNAGRISAPVLLAHGTLDRNVAYHQSTLMEGRLRGSGKRVELMTFEGLDHSLVDGAARTKLLERADGFIRAAIGG